MNKASNLHRYLILVFLIFSSVSILKAEFLISGTILSAVDGESCPGATYRIFNGKDTINPLTYNVVDLDGKFNQKLPKAGDYIIKVQ